MFPVYPQDLSEITFILSPQPVIILDSSTWLKIHPPLDKTEIQGWCWVLLIPCLQRLSPVTSAEVATPLTSFPPQPLSSQEPSSLPLDFWIAFPFASCSPSLLLSIPLRFSPEIVSKEAEVITSLPCSEFLMPLNAGSSVRAWTLQLGSLSGPSVSLSSSLLGETGITIPTS